jgi:hypothetical protein
MRTPKTLILCTFAATMMALSSASWTGKLFPELQKALHKDSSKNVQDTENFSPKVESQIVEKPEV